jgi:hypothetical protein
MPLAGTAPLLQQELYAAIFAGLQQEFDASIAPSGAYVPMAVEQQQKLATAISQMALPLIQHIITNALVAPGIAVQTVPLEGTGSTIAPGTII